MSKDGFRRTGAPDATDARLNITGAIEKVGAWILLANRRSILPTLPWTIWPGSRRAGPLGECRTENVQSIVTAREFAGGGLIACRQSGWVPGPCHKKFIGRRRGFLVGSARTEHALMTGTYGIAAIDFTATIAASAVSEQRERYNCAG